jgi:hypothetical protein
MIVWGGFRGHGVAKLPRGRMEPIEIDALA